MGERSEVNDSSVLRSERESASNQAPTQATEGASQGRFSRPKLTLNVMQSLNAVSISLMAVCFTI